MTDPKALIERVAQFLHDEGGFSEAWTGRSWPEHPDDTGQRDGGWVKIVPSYVQAVFRDVAARLLTFFDPADLITRQQAEIERLREALMSCGPLLSPKAERNMRDMAEADAAMNDSFELGMLMKLHDNVRNARLALQQEPKDVD